MKYLGLPYMGSKRKIAREIVNFILKENPKVKYFYDLFGGGGAITFEAIGRHQIKQVFYNEINTAVVELLKDILFNGIDKKYYQWIDRETFNKNKSRSDWFGGFCQVIWSYNNNQNNYLYSKQGEHLNSFFHKVIINKDQNALEYINKKYNLNLILPKIQTFDYRDQIRERRLYFRRIFVKLKKQNKLLKELEGLIRIAHLSRIDGIRNIENYSDIISDKIKIYNLSYDKVPILTPPEQTVIYLDPPYKNTATYKFDIDHEKLLEWIYKNKKYKIYVSSYEFKGLKTVWQTKHRSTFPIHNNNIVLEKLFTPY